MEVKIQIASVKVMRSHDYCHFEVSLSTTEAVTTEQVDALRKEAARLTDKAVEQYKLAKDNAEKLLGDKYNREDIERRVERIRKTPEFERTEEEKAKLKAFDDKRWLERPRYNYQDDWGDGDDD